MAEKILSVCAENKKKEYRGHFRCLHNYSCPTTESVSRWFYGERSVQENFCYSTGVMWKVP